MRQETIHGGLREALTDNFLSKQSLPETLQDYPRENIHYHIMLMFET